MGKSLANNPVVVVIGVIASCLTIIMFVTGYNTLRDMKADRSESSGSTVSATQPASIPTDPVVVSALIPLRNGQAVLVAYMGANESVSFSFEQGTSSPSQGPDLVIGQCTCDGGFGTCPRVRCVLQAAQVWQLGNVPLGSVLTLQNAQSGCSGKLLFPAGSCAMEVGQAYALTTYSGHLAKFRITQVEISGNYTGATLSFEWIYQPNDRVDFVGP